MRKSSQKRKSTPAENEGYIKGSKKSRSARNKKNEEKQSAVKQEKEDEHEDEEFTVERIVDVRIMQGKRQFKVRWSGYGPEHDEWCFENDLFCDELIHDFLRKQAESEKNNDANNSNKRKSAKQGETSKQTPNDVVVVEEDDGEEKEYEVERIIEMRMVKNKRVFLIRWKGFGQKADTWEPEGNLNCPELMEEFMKKLEQAKLFTTALRSNPKPTKRFNLSNPQARTSRRNAGKERKTYYDNE